MPGPRNPISTDGNSYNLFNITTVVGDEAGSPSIVAELRKHTPDGVLLTNFDVPLAGPPSVTALTPTSAVTLDANTTYWLILGVLGGAGSFGWSYAEGDNFVGPGALSSYAYSANQGISWDLSGNVGNPYKMSVNVDVATVPEPSTLASGAAALLVALAFRLRRY